ncbi:NDUFA12-domain-containing protein [Microstroma glucosiphilum]|uniref:NADH dehydrogenase [ubiquinone] 1 alpha subcomplex subunit n=1 Tax=Pseudomicrostroma glucosiphilum TaxID=1684307 RepID=A0A316UF03_9BASI|nr:NDUFA12-domain-containing protein [Pseudomicrostroma glucosiphilum]PWN23887.1 NDUFA12-domain-containing protein [Pseudomicrostroma glucosiphilum]
MSLARTVRIIREAGFARYWRNLNVLGDAKGGKLVGEDSIGNKYYEDPDEIPGRHRWVEFKSADFNASQCEPAWHAWLKHIQTEPPTTNPRMQNKHTWESAPQENLTGTRGMFKTYSTTKRKVHPWEPSVAPRS